FIGRDASTRCSLSASVIAGSGDSMQRDYYYDSARALSDLADAEQIGAEAGRRTLARLSPKAIRTGEYPVIFSAELARAFLGHLCSAASGGSLYRRASFLLDACGTQILPAWVQAVEDPFLPRGSGSGSFDAEGVATVHQPLIRDGVLEHYLLGSYSARKLGLQSTGNAGGLHNLLVSSNAEGMAQMIGSIQRGLLITEVMGQGVNLITGDYSRGASGFWIENGEIVHPVHEITIAGHLPTLYQRIEAIGNDVDSRGIIRCGSLLVGKMTAAAEE
ncbi:MAG: metalloprotease PmbA, partial [Xanthomonadales bacterium]|nr:metalloprotease PmbA [Xanthomonadales bacterium]